MQVELTDKAGGRAVGKASDGHRYLVDESVARFRRENAMVVVSESCVREGVVGSAGGRGNGDREYGKATTKKARSA